MRRAGTLGEVYFSVWIFLASPDAPSDGQNVSKQIQGPGSTMHIRTSSLDSGRALSTARACFAPRRVGGGLVPEGRD